MQRIFLKHLFLNQVMKTGTTQLPLHSGKAPYWLMKRMRSLSLEMTKLIVDYKGEDYFLRQLSNPYWFQAFGSVLGFDWHSSGLTTTTIGALKTINSEELNLKIAGGKGKANTITEEINNLSDQLSLSEKRRKSILYNSKMSAKIDNNLVQDNYSLYHHSIIFTKKSWAVVQQGKNNQWARRYHWLSENIISITIEPHSGIHSEKTNQNTLNLTSKENKVHQDYSLDLVRDNPEHIFKYFKESKKNKQSLSEKQTSLFKFDKKQNTNVPYYKLPRRHHIILNIDLDKRARESLKKAYEIQPQSYEELVSIRGIGKKSIRALALVSELIYGDPLSWKDPVKYSYTHGGKDGIPYPVDRKVYDNTINFLKQTLEETKLGYNEKKRALLRLNSFIKTEEETKTNN